MAKVCKIQYDFATFKHAVMCSGLYPCADLQWKWLLALQKRTVDSLSNHVD